MSDCNRDARRDRWDASEHGGELLRIATGDDVGDDSGAKWSGVAAAILPFRSTRSLAQLASDRRLQNRPARLASALSS